jgi:hypothetical protein
MLVSQSAEQPPYGTQSVTLSIDAVKEGVDTPDSNNGQGTVILRVFYIYYYYVSSKHILLQQLKPYHIKKY